MCIVLLMCVAATCIRTSSVLVTEQRMFQYSYQFLEDAYKNHKAHLENMTCQLQEKKKVIEDISNTINNGYVIFIYYFIINIKATYNHLRSELQTHMAYVHLHIVNVDISVVQYFRFMKELFVS